MRSRTAYNNGVRSTSAGAETYSDYDSIVQLRQYTVVTVRHCYGLVLKYVPISRSQEYAGCFRCDKFSITECMGMALCCHRHVTEQGT